VALVTEKPEPRKSGDNTYYNVVVADIGWQQRISCTPEVFHRVTAADGKKYDFGGKLTPVRATRQGGKFPDDLQVLMLDSVQEYVPKQPAAAPQQQPQQPATPSQPAAR